MSNTVITNYTDLNGPSTKADSSVVVIVNKDGSLSIDEKLLGAFMNSDGSQGTGISVVRVGHDGRPDDATDSETEDDTVPHVTLSVDSYYDEPNSIVKYDSGAEMLQSLRLETRENSLLGFQNDHCYISHISSNEILPPSENFPGYDEPILEIKPQTPEKTHVSNTKKITALEQHVIPKGKKIVINPSDSSLILKGNDLSNTPLPTPNKPKQLVDHETAHERSSESKNIGDNDETADTTSVSSSAESVPDRDSDSDYKDTQEKAVLMKTRQKFRTRPRILKSQSLKGAKEKIEKVGIRARNSKASVKREIKDKVLSKNTSIQEKKHDTKSKEDDINVSSGVPPHISVEQKQIQKVIKKEKKPPAHMSALLSDMTSLFSSPDVIRRVSSDSKSQLKTDKTTPVNKIISDAPKTIDSQEEKDSAKAIENNNKVKDIQDNTQKENPVTKSKVAGSDKLSKVYESIPQLDEASLAQILQDTPVSSVSKGGISNNPIKDVYNPSNNTMNSPSLAGPLSPTLDLLGGLQPEEEGLTEDLLMHVAQLVESSENLQEVIDKQVLGKVDTVKSSIQSQYQPSPSQTSTYNQNTPKISKLIVPRKDPIEIVRKDGRIITLPPIEAPATRASKRKSQLVSSQSDTPIDRPPTPSPKTPEPQFVQQLTPRHYVNKKLANKKQESPVSMPSVSKLPAESEENWNSEDDPDRLWCICKQPHNNRFMICCDRCEDWFHGKCVNITKAMGHQMEQQGIEWTCPNCIKKTQTPKQIYKSLLKNQDSDEIKTPRRKSGEIKSSIKRSCIVCKKEARANSIYCSESCIKKYVQDSLGSQTSLNKSDESGKTLTKHTDSKVIVFDRTTGKCLEGPSAENLKEWLQKNPTFEVVRPGSLSAIKPNTNPKKTHPQRVQTILNFDRIPRKSITSPEGVTKPPNLIEPKELKSPNVLKDDILRRSSNKIPVTPKHNLESTKPSSPRAPTEVKKSSRTFLKQQSTEKATTPTDKMSTPKKKEKETESKAKANNSSEPIRDNVKKSLQEQLQIRMSENENAKFTEEEIRNFAIETEAELHELFKDVGVKYKAKYRSLMFNIKDRKNLSLWEKICNRDITPKMLVRLSPEELASQELAQWRDKEAKHQLELIKKSELDLLAANKTYVLKTHKGEEVMETKKSVSTELDPNVPVEDVVTALNDSTTTEETLRAESPKNSPQHSERKSTDEDHHSSRREREDKSKSRSKKSNKHPKKGEEHRTSRRLHSKQKIEKTTEKKDKRKSRARSGSKDRSRPSDPQLSGSSKRKSRSPERLRNSSPSRTKIRHKSGSPESSKTRSHSRSRSLRRDRSQSRGRSKHHSPSRETRSKHRSTSRETRSKQRLSSQESQLKKRSTSQEPRPKHRSTSRETRSKQRLSSQESQPKKRSTSREPRTKHRSASRETRSKQRLSSQESQAKKRSTSRETRSKQRLSSQESQPKKRSTSRETQSKHRSTSRETRSKQRLSSQESQPEKRSTSRETRLKHRSTSGETTSKRRSRSRETRRPKRRSSPKEAPSQESSTSRETRSKLRSRSKHRTDSTENVKARSHSQEINADKKHEEPVERPKSASLTEIHPEYDPHERMVTSAVSEEDLHKLKDDVYEDNYSYEITPSTSKIGDDYDPLKSFTITTSSRNTRHNSTGKETESDQEPTSTVDMSAMLVWSGCINMVDVARLYVTAHEVSGNGADLEEDLNAELDIVGRINPDTVWDYISKMKRTGNKDVVVILRLSAANDEEKMPYIALYTYLSSRNRLGVVKVANTTTLKDFYIFPLPANAPMPQVLLPLEGPGLEEVRTPLLIAIVIRQRKKRAAPTIPKDIIPAKVARESRNRSYTPPVSKTYTPPASPRRRAPLPMPAPYTSPALSTSVKDKIAASLACADDEAYSPGSASSGGSAEPTASDAPAAPAADALRSKMEELNRQIEEQKQQIRKMTQADSSVGEDEAYSPSRPMTPPTPVVPLADIALPSNLQEILATIKQREAGAPPPPLADVDMRTAYVPPDLPPAPPPGPH